MEKIKRQLSSLLAVVMILGMMTTNVKAETEENNMIQLEATEVEGTPRLDAVETKPSEQKVEQAYAKEDVVTVIVEMKEDPIIEYYSNTKTNLFSLGEEDSAGKSISNFLTSKDAKEVSEDLTKNQNKIISKITSIKNGNSKLKSSEKIEVVKTWSTLVNAIAIRVPYGMIEEIRSIDGVKRAYVEHVYDIPEPVENSVVQDDKGTYSYSYDMVGVEETWGEGYTGKEMVVAVLDSGLDIKMDWTYKVVRTHEAFTDNSFKSGNPTDGENDWELRYDATSVEKFMKDNQINSNTGVNGDKLAYDNNTMYKNLKVPYAFDYADYDFNVLNPNSDHGTHVTGTVAGFATTEEGEVKFSGVSPDAQVLFMKVFSNNGGGATENVLISALEDSLKLGADVINLSLGSSNGFSDDDTFQNDVFNRVNKAGIVLMTSAGNSYKSSEGNNYNGNTTTSNPDESMISSPAVYNSNLSVASMENTIDVKPYLNWTDDKGIEHKVYFNDPWSVAMKADFADKEYPIYAVDGVGTYDDYYNAGFNNGKTGLALVKRGDISFKDKINNALYFSGRNSQGEAYGVLGVIVYDNNPDGTELITMSVEGTGLDSAYISGKDGAEIVNAIKAGYQVKIKVSKVDETVDSSTAGQMSSFTSWGAGPGLELKPDITAPGGNIWSTVLDKVNTDNEGYIGSYEMMSGTSMAAPHMAGIGSLIRQRVTTDSAFEGVKSDDISDVVSQLLVSTAVPKKDGDGVYFSPRQQGAGLVDAAAAAKTPAYITVDNEKVGKLELGDDAKKTGSFKINFNLNNISKDSVKYNAEIVLMRPKTSTDTSKWGDRNTISDNNTIIKTLYLGTISAAAGENQEFSKSVSLTEDEKAELNSIFVNGTYIEGYVILTDATGNSNPQLGLPMLAYYGDWTKAPIFDSSLWIDEPEDGESVLNNESTWGTSVVGSYQINDMYGVIGFFNLGQNIFDGTSDNSQLIYHKENIAISPNGDEYMDRIDNYVLYQLRDAKVIVVEAKDAETGEVYMREWTPYATKSLYEPSLGVALPYSVYDTIPTWDGTDLNGNVLPTGTKCIYTITAYGEGDYGDKVFNDEYNKDVTNFDSIIPGENVPTFNGHDMDMAGDIISFPVLIDTVAPKLQNNAVSFYEKDGRTYITGKVYDEDGSLASIEIVPYIKRTYKEGYGDPNYSDIGIDKNNPFFIENIYEPATKELTFTVDVTEYTHSKESFPGENNYYDYTWTGNIMISCGDYAINDRSYSIKVDSSEGIVLSQTSALLKPGQQFELSVNNNTSEESTKITRTSSNTEVATVDEYGKITAIAVGQATITVSNGTSSAVCIVAVEEEQSDIKSFNLSMDSFSTLKPDGQIVVNVNNIQPADAKIKNITWEVVQDKEFTDKFGAGLIRVGKNTADSLSGYVYLSSNIAAEAVPGSNAEIRVTIDGIQRVMKVDWEKLYQVDGEDNLISAAAYNDQATYITQGETATLTAKYRQSNLHSIGPVTTTFKGIKLDGPDFFPIGGNYKAKIVNEEGYGLPSEIKLYTVYPEYNVEIKNYSWTTNYTYDPITGEINLKYAPSGATNKLLIVADGVEVEGAPAGTMSGQTYEKPDELFGPFNWTIKNGNGELYVGEVETGGTKHQGAKYTPAEPGISYITATTKDGKYSVDFAVITKAVLADKLTLDKNKAEIKVGETITPITTLSPTPTFESDQDLTWTSFNPEVATVSEDGTITAVSDGYAYIKVNATTNNKLKNYYIVKVVSNYYDVTFKDYDGTVLKEEIVQEGNNATAPEDPKRDGYKFTGWDGSFEKVTKDLVVTAQYSKIDNGGSDNESKSFTVIFKDYDGAVLKNEVVEEGKSATAPEDPKRDGYKFIGWDGSFEKVTKDLVVTAQYYKIDNGSSDNEKPPVVVNPDNGYITVNKITDPNGKTEIVVDSNKKVIVEITDIEAIENGTGSIVVKKGESTIEIPISIIDKSLLKEGSRVVFTMIEEVDTELTKGLKAVNKVFEFNLSIVTGDETIRIHNFKDGVATVTLSLTDDELKGLDKSKLAVFYYNETTNKYEEMETTVDGNKIIFKTSHFSKFIIAEKTVGADGTTLPNTGGNDWSTTLLLSIILCSTGVFMITRKKRQTS